MHITDLPLVGGHPALDLVNSLERGQAEPGTGPHDYLTGPGALLSWAGRVELLDVTETADVSAAWARNPGSGHAAVDACRDIREALHTTVLTATGGVARDEATLGSALDHLQQRWAAACARSTLTLDPDRSCAVRQSVGVVPGLLIADRAAQVAIDLLRTVGLGRVRRCPPDAGGCGWLFLDRTRNGSRKWCRMADCGTQVKSRRLTQRRRAARGGPRAAG